MTDRYVFNRIMDNEEIIVVPTLMDVRLGIMLADRYVDLSQQGWEVDSKGGCVQTVPKHDFLLHLRTDYPRELMQAALEACMVYDCRAVRHFTGLKFTGMSKEMGPMRSYLYDYTGYSIGPINCKEYEPWMQLFKIETEDTVESYYEEFK